MRFSAAVVGLLAAAPIVFAAPIPEAETPAPAEEATHAAHHAEPQAIAHGVHFKNVARDLGETTEVPEATGPTGAEIQPPHGQHPGGRHHHPYHHPAPPTKRALQAEEAEVAEEPIPETLAPLPHHLHHHPHAKHLHQHDPTLAARHEAAVEAPVETAAEEKAPPHTSHHHGEEKKEKRLPTKRDVEELEARDFTEPIDIDLMIRDLVSDDGAIMFERDVEDEPELFARYSDDAEFYDLAARDFNEDGTQFYARDFNEEELMARWLGF